VALTVIWVVLLDVVLMAGPQSEDAGTGAHVAGARADQAAAAGARPLSTPSLTWTGAISDLRVIASSADTVLVGRAVDIKNAPINAIASRGGFWLVSNGERVFVQTADETHFKRGQRVNLRGVVLELPDDMKNRLDDFSAAQDETIYIYATQVRAVT
jgi:hypothetical protein